MAGRGTRGLTGVFEGLTLDINKVVKLEQTLDRMSYPLVEEKLFKEQSTWGRGKV